MEWLTATRTGHWAQRDTFVSHTVKRGLTALAFLVALTGACVLFVVRNPGTPSPGPSPSGAAGGKAKGPALAPFSDKLVGSESAQVEALALLPFSTGCQDDIGLYLLDLARENGRHVNVRLLDMKSEAARAVMRQHGLRCACVIVNGETRFDLGGETGKLLLEGPMDLEDVREVLKSELAAAYGGGAPVPKPVPPKKARPGNP